MDTTPNTINYLIGGYTVFAVLMTVYIASLVVRWNSLKEEKKILEEIVMER